VLGERIVRLYQANRQVYGSPRIHAALRAEGQQCGRKRVARLMREQGLSAKRRTHRVRTTDSQHEHPVAPNLLNRDFTASAPNTKWVADITGVWTWEGWLYLAVVLDIFSRMVVGWAMDQHREEALVEQAALMALARRHPEPGLLHHSDRGSQYTCQDYRALLAHCGIVVSMSRKADCYDNALMESFIGTLKSECVDRESYQTQEEARHSIFEYLEVFYNRQRLHSSLGYVSPVMYEQHIK
jgi:transposase InsO family protein